MINAGEQQQEVLQQEALDWLTRVSLGNATEADLASLRRWRDTSPAHAAALARAGRLWRELGPLEVDLAQLDMASMPVTQIKKHRLSRRLVLGGACATAGAAAAVVMMVRPPFGLWPSMAELDADYRTRTGEQRRLALSDAVSIEMNTQTSISVLHAADGGGVELISGETAVTISRPSARPFAVVAAGGRIMAHQAVFNVRRNGSDVCVTCIDGGIRVEQSVRSLDVGASQQVSYDAKRLGQVVAADPTKVAAWRDGMLVFRGTPLTQVIDEVNRYRPGRIILMDATLGRRLITARFEINHLDAIAGQIGHVFKVPVKTLPGGLVLLG